MNNLRSYMANLVLLGLLCLVVEQAGYCFLIQGYFLKLVISPVFWGCLSGLCFYALWKTKPRNNSDSAHDKPNGREHIYNPVLDDPMSMSNPDNMFSRNLRCW